MKTIAYYFERLGKHVREGSLLRRFQHELTMRRHARMDKWWDAQRVHGEFFDAEVEPGVKLRLHYDSAIARDIYCHDHETGERAFVRRLLRRGDVFVDIGANLGLYSVIASRLVGDSGMVFSFEPDPATYERLRHNMDVNDCTNVRTFQIALSSEDETRMMNISNAGFDAYNSFGTPVRGDGTFEQHEVTCVSFDSFAAKEPRAAKAVMMKVDVEGWETMVLRGAMRRLSASDAPVLLVEFNDHAALSTGHSCQELYRWLAGRGYAMYLYDARDGILKPLPLRDHYIYDNVIAIKDASFVKGRLDTSQP